MWIKMKGEINCPFCNGSGIAGTDMIGEPGKCACMDIVECCFKCFKLYETVEINGENFRKSCECDKE